MQRQSTRSKRVVRSALAAEAAALATGQDMSILLRALIARVLGIGDPKNSWRDKLRAIPPQLTWKDCRSSHDMLHMDGAMPTERRVALDIYDVRQYLDEDDLGWVLTIAMLADPLQSSSAAATPPC